MKVLISAYACNPAKGSEPGIGWNWAVQAARFHDVWVMTRGENRAAIEEELSRLPVSNLHFVYHDPPRYLRPFPRPWPSVHLYYLLWQRTALKTARRLHREVDFDLAHHLTYVTFRFPSFLAKLGIPYIWGPVGGGETAPLRFYPTFGAAGIAKQIARATSNRLAKLLPAVRATAHRASQILVATPETARVLPRSVQDAAKVVQAIGVMPPPISSPGVIPQKTSFRMLFVGRLLYLKGVQFAIPALAKLAVHHPDASLTVVGDGRFRSYLEQQVSRLGLAERVWFTGDLPRTDVLRMYEDHDVFLFPSLQDSGGLVVLEAMAAGLPVVCLDIGGPALTVTPATGIKIAVHNPDQVVNDLTDALSQLAQDFELRKTLGDAGRQRVVDVYNWDRKGVFLRDLYATLLDESS